MYSLPRSESGTAASYPSIEDLGPRIKLYTPAFAIAPYAAYGRMRQDGRTLAPVELAPGIPATLVLSYHTAVRILNDPERFPADPRIWQKTIPAGHPLLPMLGWRPNPLRCAGREHAVYRDALKKALMVVDLLAVRERTIGVAAPLINSFCQTGSAELIEHYITPLVFTVLNETVGCPPNIGERLQRAIAAMFEGIDTETVNIEVASALFELIDLKRISPGADIASRLVHHCPGLSDEERMHQLVTIYSAGIEPVRNLVANTLRRMLTDPRYRHDNDHFTPPVRDAVEETLAHDPPLANLCNSYPRTRTLVDKVWLPANQPVLVSMAACTTDPAIVGDKGWTDNRSHLAYGSGPHTCPDMAREMSKQIAVEAIAQFFDAFPEAELAVPAREVGWRPGPFHRAPAAVPVTFPHTPPLIIPSAITHR
ncbi:cytochrome P450 [Nocardia australiensis]|uniref:cytochrome P450 n=1 Tax=Nocardia australiensis TaxID=2887191 RepID=UPI001D15B654|nr:cytochrome P450 [Nocardia australiensis]